MCRGECLFSDDYLYELMWVQRIMFVFRWLSFSVNVCAEENVFRWLSLCVNMCAKDNVFRWLSLCVNVCAEDNVFRWLSFSVNMCAEENVFRWLSLYVNVCAEENVCLQMIIFMCQHVCRGECLFSDDYLYVLMCVQRRMFVFRWLSLYANYVCAEENVFRWLSLYVNVCAEENVCLQMIIIHC